MTDLFDEVEEQLRSDRYRTLAAKVLPWVLVALVAALVAALAYWGWDTYRKQAAATASEQYAQAMGELQMGQQAKAVELLTKTSQGSAKGYKALALMQLAGLKLQANQIDAGVKLLDEAAAAAPDPIIGDAARLKSALALLDTKPYSEVEARLKPLMEDGRPYRAQAREALAMAKLTKGDTAGARSDFTIINSTLDAPESARVRAKAAIQLIDAGSANATAAAVRAQAAAALNPPAPQGEPAPQQPQATGPQ